MKISTLLYVTACLFLALQVQAQNPWKELGYKPKHAPLTLSNGEYQEFFENDSIVEIGSVLFNTKTSKVISFIEKDTLYGEADLRPEVISRWLSLDPLMAKYPSMSPYNFASNNPIYYIDPDGQDIIPSPLFNASNYGKVHQYLMNSNSIYQQMLSKYKSSHSFNLHFDVNDKNIGRGYGGVTKYTYDSKNVNGVEVSTSADTHEDFTKSSSTGTITAWHFYIVIHEANHATEALDPEIARLEPVPNPSLMQDDHVAFTKQLNQAKNAYSELSKDLGLGWDNSQIHEIALYGSENSKTFRKYIRELSEQNKTSYEDESNKYKDRVKLLLDKKVNIPAEKK